MMVLLQEIMSETQTRLFHQRIKYNAISSVHLTFCFNSERFVRLERNTMAKCMRIF